MKWKKNFGGSAAVFSDSTIIYPSCKEIISLNKYRPKPLPSVTIRFSRQKRLNILFKLYLDIPIPVFTDNKDLSLEYQYRHEGVSDYITSPVNIPELIRRICCFVEE